VSASQARLLRQRRHAQQRCARRQRQRRGARPHARGVRRRRQRCAARAGARRVARRRRRRHAEVCASAVALAARAYGPRERLLARQRPACTPGSAVTLAVGHAAPAGRQPADRGRVGGRARGALAGSPALGCRRGAGARTQQLPGEARRTAARDGGGALRRDGGVAAALSARDAAVGARRRCARSWTGAMPSWPRRAGPTGTSSGRRLMRLRGRCPPVLPGPSSCMRGAGCARRRRLQRGATAPAGRPAAARRGGVRGHHGPRRRRRPLLAREQAPQRAAQLQHAGCWALPGAAASAWQPGTAALASGPERHCQPVRTTVRSPKRARRCHKLLCNSNASARQRLAPPRHTLQHAQRVHLDSTSTPSGRTEIGKLGGQLRIHAHRPWLVIIVVPTGAARRAAGRAPCPALRCAAVAERTLKAAAGRQAADAG